MAYTNELYYYVDQGTTSANTWTYYNTSYNYYTYTYTLKESSNDYIKFNIEVLPEQKEQEEFIKEEEFKIKL